MTPRLAAHLLRSHVADRPQHHAHAGQRFNRRRRTVGRRLKQLRDAEIEDLHQPLLSQKQILGFDVAMDDALSVRGGKAFRDLRYVLQDHPLRKRVLASQACAERLPFQQLGDDVGNLAMPADVVDRQDVGVAERGRHPSLSFESFEAGRVRNDRRRQNLDRDVAAEAGVTGAIDSAHASRSEQRDDLVRTQTRARTDRGAFCHRRDP